MARELTPSPETGGPEPGLPEPGRPEPARPEPATPERGRPEPPPPEPSPPPPARSGPAPPRPIGEEGDGPPPAWAPDPLQIVEVEFKGLRRDYFAFRHTVPLRPREYVVVEADRGQDIGRVKRRADGESPCGGGCDAVGDRPMPPPEKRILRRAAPADVERLLQLRRQEMEVRRRTRELVVKHGLKMKVSEAEWQWDRNKLTVYFTAERRVDFRALVREMAGTFRTRIELRQIGVRDEAKRLGGIGRCRRELCCRSWLPRIEPVTLQLAKDQDLSLNPSQISGACGRLMNCLRYEHSFYRQAEKRFPPEGQRLQTGRGEEVVVGWDIFRERVSLRDADGDTRTVALDELKRETARGRPGPSPERG